MCQYYKFDSSELVRKTHEQIQHSQFINSREATTNLFVNSKYLFNHHSIGRVKKLGINNEIRWGKGYLLSGTIIWISLILAYFRFFELFFSFDNKIALMFHMEKCREMNNSLSNNQFTKKFHLIFKWKMEAGVDPSY